MSDTLMGAKYATIPEVADRYRTTEATIRYWRATGYGPKSIRVGRRVLFPLEDLEAFDAQLKQESAA